jgi:hypothetical protein
MKMLIEFWMDGYDTPEEMREACMDYVKEELDMTASSIEILWAESAKDVERGW